MDVTFLTSGLLQTLKLQKALTHPLLPGKHVHFQFLCHKLFAKQHLYATCPNRLTLVLFAPLYFSSLTPKITVKPVQIQTTPPNPLFWAEQNTKVSRSMCYAFLKRTIIILLLFHFPTYYYYSTTHLFHTRLNNPGTAISFCTQLRITHPTSFKQVGSGPGRGVVVGRAHTGKTALT